mgnify:CR=1 FL=1
MPRNKYPEQTVEKILDAAALLFTQKGYQNTTLQDIIDATKLSKGAVYHHFRSKEEIAQRVGDRLGDQMWEPLRHIRDDPSLTGLQKLQAVFAVSFAGQRQQQIAQTLPHLCSNPQFLAMELTNIEAHLAPECIAPMIRQGMLHPHRRCQCAGGSAVRAGRHLAFPPDAPHHADPAAGAESRVSANDPCAWAGSFDGCTGCTAGAAVHTGQRLNFPGGTLRPFLYTDTDQRFVNKKQEVPMNTFFLIVLGQIISLFGNAALRFALPLYLLRQTGSAALYGGITALAMLPALAGMLTGGALADRCRKARLMALLDLVTAGISAAAAAGLPHLPLLPLILTVLGSLYAIQGLYQPVVRACLPLLLNGTQLLRGNAVIQLVDTVDELLGPLLGAVLLEHLGIRGLLALCGGCFALSAGMELCLRIPQDVPRDTKLSVRSLWTDLRESARFLTGQAAVLRLAAAMAAVNLLEVPALTVGVPVLVVQTLQKSDASLGLVQAVLSAGGILGGVLAGTVFVRHPIRSGTGLLLALSGVCAALGLTLRVPTLQFGSILVLGAVFMAVAALFNVWFFAQLQMLVPQAQLGKTTACISVLACLTQPIGQAAYGSAFQHWAAHPADVLLAAGVLSALVLWLLQTRRTA